MGTGHMCCHTTTIWSLTHILDAKESVLATPTRLRFFVILKFDTFHNCQCNKRHVPSSSSSSRRWLNDVDGSRSVAVVVGLSLFLVATATTTTTAGALFPLQNPPNKLLFYLRWNSFSPSKEHNSPEPRYTYVFRETGAEEQVPWKLLFFSDNQRGGW